MLEGLWDLTQHTGEQWTVQSGEFRPESPVRATGWGLDSQELKA